jgi:tetratricopeptide (TPR) repeat protein
MFSKIVVLSLFILPSAWSSLDGADRNHGRGTIGLTGQRKTLIELISSGYYYSSIPWMKEYIVKNDRALDGDIEDAFDVLLDHTGVRIFESLPVEVLKRSRSGSIHYILAKRLFKQGQSEAALNELRGISPDHSSYPFVTHLRGSIYSSLKNHKEAETQFRDCINASERRKTRVQSLVLKRQLEMNRDYCLAGVGRAEFASGDYKKAELSYLDISKDSSVWPEILFEEAWTSYYLKNYNRSLGKLVSYKAPVFDFIFKPEVEVLKALTFMKMCLYEDAKKTVDDFYRDLLNPSRDLRSFLISRGKDYRYYYSLMVDHEENHQPPIAIVGHILKSIGRDSAFREMKSSLIEALAEYNQLRKKKNSQLNDHLLTNIKTIIDEIKTTMGAYVRSSLVSKYSELYSAFEGMSYIKLEVLAQRKERLYQTDEIEGKKRGDVRYIERNDKQYFWTFNGEFWADELGDYVFALRSEC